MSFTKESAYAAVTRFVVENGRYPTKYDVKKVDYLPPPTTMRRLIGNLRSLTILEDVYRENPIRCKYCDEAIPFNKRKTCKYCNQSCSAKHNNTERKKKRECWATGAKCISCNSYLTNRYSKYCSTNCQQEFQYKEKKTDWLATGCTVTNRFIRKVLQETIGHKCDVCGISDWNEKPIVLEVEHKNGNSEDCSVDNVCLICPNCHSQTPTYKGRNKGNGRHKRMERYYDGKSY